MQTKILEVIDSLGSGGAESLLKNFILESKNNEQFQIEIATLYSASMFKDDLFNAGLQVWDFNLQCKYDIRGIVKLINLIKKRKYHIIHVHLFPADIYSAIASLFLPQSLKWIFSEHNIYNRRRSIKLFKLIDTFTYSRFQKIICVSKQVESTLLEWVPSVRGKTLVIPNAVPIPKNLNENYSKIYDILFVGRLTKAKGVDILLKAIAILKDRFNKKVKVAIVGSGPLRADLINLSKRLKLDKEIDFLGIRKDIENLMKTSSIFILPSRWEGLPMVILEAMSYKMPIIATDVGGISEVIEDKKEGILVHPENKEVLAVNIKILLEDKNMRNFLGQNAYKRISSKHSIKVYSQEMLHFYMVALHQRIPD